MRKPTIALFTLLLPLALVAGESPVKPIAAFERTSSAENLQPAFNVAGGQTTGRGYSGLVEILVSGSGLNNVQLPDVRSDAFYNFSAGPNQSQGLFDNTLRLGTETPILKVPRGFAWQPNSSLHIEAGSIHLANLAVAYEGESEPVEGPFPLDVSGGIAPAYSPAHLYHLVIDLGCYSGKLTLGFGDGGVFDNSGDAYHITLWTVARQGNR